MEMESDPADPTFGELEAEGQLSENLVLVHGRLLGGDWPGCRLTMARDVLREYDLQGPPLRRRVAHNPADGQPGP